ncbi:hydantoinase B/oxoprolinase family protein [Planctomicrobium sp. SH661]|uniref:hydantoinase B/oxoprolinase family protein n=1 Tax=Planctomicrobium sp. SH661 TaxID=3448124 RepID=UPI003F5C010F
MSVDEIERRRIVKRWQFWIDVGGTFTDCVAETPQGELITWKTLSSGAVHGVIESSSGMTILDRQRAEVPPDFWKGWRIQSGHSIDSPAWQADVVASSPDGQLTLSSPFPGSGSGEKYQLQSEESAPLVCVRRLLQLRLDESIPPIDLRMGTTRGTNALLERKGAKTAFLVTKGFGDILLIGNQDRPELFVLDIHKPEPLTRIVVEVEERLNAKGEVLRELDEERTRQQLGALAEQGINSLAICLLHAYRNPVHEVRLEELAREAGFVEISRSSRVAPVIKLVPRAETTVLDAYLNPVLRTYVRDIQSRLGPGSTFKLMGSQGGLIHGNDFSGRDSILSGPAGGVIAFSTIARQNGFQNSIGFDMGGTSTDVSRFGGKLDLESETVKAGIRIASSVLSIETVAAGGGSLCQYDGVQLRVGPESAGADPGPACYGRGGPLTITDMNVALGRVLPDRFPFPLDRPAVDRQLDELRDAINSSGSPRNYSREELAQGFIEIANETMARAIRQISIRKGYDPADHVLVCFGGAGGQHACALARMLNIRTILLHPYAGILSAYGMGLADVRRRGERSVLKPYSPAAVSELSEEFESLESELRGEVLKEGIPQERIAAPVRSLNLRYRGVESAILIETPQDGDYQRAFEAQHQQLYGYLHTSRPLEIVGLATEVIGRLDHAQPPRLSTNVESPTEIATTPAWFDQQFVQAKVFESGQLRGGQSIDGPAILCHSGSTLWIEPGFQATVKETGEVLIALPDAPQQRGFESVEDVADPVQLEIFNNRFASIAEQMGVTLRKTSISTNVKERLDYSCALFDASGGLVVNAPHIPVHLGAMGETIRCLLRDNPVIHPGDVFLTNDPYAGGSHLPDLTVVTPVHDSVSGELLFLTASRAHHAEIGGITPGSMPPFSRLLGEEGVLITNFKLLDRGVSRSDELLQRLTSGSWPSRNPQDNLADISAQMAANQVGVRLLEELVEQCSRERVQRYMGFIQEAAEFKMQRALSSLPEGVYERTDHLDDGSPIAVRITIRDGRAELDFTGTGPVLKTNLNANRAIVTAAVMYVFRCLIDDPIPLNSGVLRPIEIKLPECLLNPPVLEDRSQCAAMVGGNVETSQRVVDVLLGALGLAAASQGTMNNLTFGDATFGYYETICGGAGATAAAPGADAVHTHMTNTRLTDVEVFENRYPARINQFAVRASSGGAGRNPGGNGIRREFEFERPLKVSLLTQRRRPYPPFGLHGGQPGALGQNLLIKAGAEDVELLPGAAQLEVQPGDRLIIETPGGGGYGR